MSFSPVLPLGGYVGFRFLKRTMPTQTATFAAQAAVKRDEAYFREKIGSVKTADQLVSDKRLLRVALGAFGLEGDFNSGFFIRKVLADGTLKDGALANRLADKQYQRFSAAFGFGDFSIPNTQLSDFPDKILTAYKERQFEAAVGVQNGDLRLALNAEREVKTLADRRVSEDTKWFTVMGNAPMRKVFQTAFGLPTSFGALDLDRQLTTLKQRAAAIFGDSTVSQFTDPKKLDDLIRRFLVRSEADGSAVPTGRAASALTILQQASFNARLR